VVAWIRSLDLNGHGVGNYIEAAAHVQLSVVTWDKGVSCRKMILSRTKIRIEAVYRNFFFECIARSDVSKSSNRVT
jgi:hypothetical protein